MAEMCEETRINDQRLRFLLSGVCSKAWIARHNEVEAGLSDLRTTIQDEKSRKNSDGSPSAEGRAIANWLEEHQDDIRTVLKEVAKHDFKFTASSGVERLMDLKRRVSNVTHPHGVCKSKAA